MYVAGLSTVLSSIFENIFLQQMLSEYKYLVPAPDKLTVLTLETNVIISCIWDTSMISCYFLYLRNDSRKCITSNFGFMIQVNNEIQLIKLKSRVQKKNCNGESSLLKFCIFIMVYICLCTYSILMQVGTTFLCVLST